MLLNQNRNPVISTHFYFHRHSCIFFTPTRYFSNEITQEVQLLLHKKGSPRASTPSYFKKDRRAQQQQSPVHPVERKGSNPTVGGPPKRGNNETAMAFRRKRHPQRGINFARNAVPKKRPQARRRGGGGNSRESGVGAYDYFRCGGRGAPAEGPFSFSRRYARRNWGPAGVSPRASFTCAREIGREITPRPPYARPRRSGLRYLPADPG